MVWFKLAARCRMPESHMLQDIPSSFMDDIRLLSSSFPQSTPDCFMLGLLLSWPLFANATTLLVVARQFSGSPASALLAVGLQPSLDQLLGQLSPECVEPGWVLITQAHSIQSMDLCANRLSSRRMSVYLHPIWSKRSI